MSDFWATVCKTVALCYRTVVLHVPLSCPVCDVGVAYCNQAVGWIEMKLGTHVGLGPGHIVLDGDPFAPSPQKRSTAAPKFSAHVCCGQTAGWIKMPLGTEVGVDPGDIVLDGDPAAPHGKGHSSPHFSAHVYCSQTVAHLSYC